MLARGVLGMFRYDERATLSGIGVPVLVVTGDRDRVLVPQVSARMRDALPAAELLVLRPAGHMGNWEHHERFVAAVEALRDALPAPSGLGVPAAAAAAGTPLGHSQGERPELGGAGAVEGLVAAVEAGLGPVDLLVNNAAHRAHRGGVGGGPARLVALPGGQPARGVSVRPGRAARDAGARPRADRQRLQRDGST